jgi:hypothetical protein
MTKGDIEALTMVMRGIYGIQQLDFMRTKWEGFVGVIKNIKHYDPNDSNMQASTVLYTLTP